MDELLGPLVLFAIAMTLTRPLPLRPSRATLFNLSMAGLLVLSLILVLW